MQRLTLRLGGRHVELVTFSARPRQVLRLLARGLMDVEIAHRLHSAPATVRTHINTMCREACVRNRTELLAWLMQNPQIGRRGGAACPGLHPEGCTCGAPFCATMRDIEEAA